MRTIADIKKELKAKGVKGITGKKKCELERMLEKHNEKSEAEKNLQPPKAPTKLKTAPCSCSHGEKKETKKPVTKTPAIDKAIKIPKEKISMNLQEKLAKANLRGGVKMKYNV